MAGNPEQLTTTTSAHPDLAVGTRVRVHPEHDTGTTGTIVEDFGEGIGIPVEIGTTRIVDRARRWAVVLDDGGLAFLDTEHLALLD